MKLAQTLAKLRPALQPALDDSHRAIIWIYGARNTGKTTLATALPTCAHVSIDCFASTPTGVQRIMQEPHPLILDEYPRTDWTLDSTLRAWHQREGGRQQGAVIARVQYRARAATFLAAPLIVISTHQPRDAALRACCHLIHCKRWRWLFGYTARIISNPTR